ncbi:MAG: hypothetical protein WBV69_10350 [Candidatus Sulfotelmatobacter sp.]
MGTKFQYLSSVIGNSVLAGFFYVSMAYGQSVASRSVVSTNAVTPTSTAPTITTTNDADIVVDPASLLPDLPALHPSRTTLIGGTIQRVDRVRDQLTVQIFGGGKMKMLFDPRTEIHEGNTLASPPDLRVGDRVYVDTILDGSTIFARNIRLATNPISGKSQGVIMSYRADKGELELRDALSPEPVKLSLTPRTQVVQDGHSAFASQLVPGTLVDVSFVTQKNDRDVQQIAILAVPGSDFTFAGQVISLDLRIGLLVLRSATDHKTYEIYLDPSRVAVDDRLHIGADVSTVANFDGSRYVARSLTVNSQ